jgi:transposase-like protein
LRGERTGSPITYRTEDHGPVVGVKNALISIKPAEGSLTLNGRKEKMKRKTCWMFKERLEDEDEFECPHCKKNHQIKGGTTDLNEEEIDCECGAKLKAVVDRPIYISIFLETTIGEPETYTCDQCEQERSDNGPYERSDGEYECQDCMEKAQSGRELRAEMTMEDALDIHTDQQIEEAKIKKGEENGNTESNISEQV